MKFKLIAVIALAIFFAPKGASAIPSWAGFWSVDNLTTPTPLHNLWVKTNSATSVTIHVQCSRATNDLNFSLKFSVGTFDQNADGYSNTGFHMYDTFTVTQADFDNYSPGSILVTVSKTFTIDSRTQSLGTKNFALFQIESNGFGGTNTVSCYPSFPIIYIPYQGTYDSFPSSITGSQFNYSTGFTTFKTITPNDNTPVLTVGQKIYSPSNKVYLTLQTDGNVVLRKINSNGTETSLWATMTNGKPSASLYFQTDGNLVVYPGTNTPASHTANSGLWGSNIFPSPGLNHVAHAFFRLQDDGNLVYIWPNYDRYFGVIDIIMGAADSGTGPSPHLGSLFHPLWSPVLQQESASNFTPIPQ